MTLNGYASGKPSFERVASNHIRALRYYHPRLYNASQPRLSSVVGLGLAITAVSIIVLGKVLRAVYESDRAPRSSSASSRQPSSRGVTSGPSKWVQKEYTARKGEKPDETKARFKKQEEALAAKYKEKKKSEKKEDYERYIIKKSDERRRDVEKLKKMLEGKKLEPIGLDKDPGWMVKSKSKDKDTDKGKHKSKGDDEEKGKVDGKKAKDEEKKVKHPEGMTMRDKIRVALLGRTMAESMKKDKAKPTPTPPAATIQAVPQKGRGWQVADSPAANAALAQSAGNAEALAKGMGK